MYWLTSWGIHKKDKNKSNSLFYGISISMLKQLLLIIRIYFEKLIDLVFGYLFESQAKKIPDLKKSQSILLESAVSLASKIRNKQLKAEDLMRATIDRIKDVNPILNAVTDERFEDALKDAQEVDHIIEQGVPDEYFQKKPFLGVPFTAKESHAVKDMLHTLGIASRRHIRASEDAECVRLLREAGAIPVAVTNVPELNKWQETRNMVFGQTRNPHHTGRTTGGSSGGEAALQAAIAVPISLCSDIGGSTRMPAFYCGLYALNPTAGHTSMKGSVLRSGQDPTMASIGFVSRHHSDLAPLTKVVAGHKAQDLDLDRPVDVKKLRYFYVESAKDPRVSPICKELREAMNKVINKLTEEATSTEYVPKPYYHEGFNHMYSLWRYWMTKETDNFAKLLTNNKGEARFFEELPKKLIGKSNYTLAAIMKLADDQILPAVDAEWAEKLTAKLKQDLTDLLGTDGVLIFPSAPTPAPYHYSAVLKPYNFAYWGIFNVLKFPAAQIPVGVSAECLPLGVQAAAGPHQDALCTATAAFLGPALGSDIGGSTRMPAFYCGLYALNPTAGHTSMKGSVLRSGQDPTMASIGFVSRHHSDLAPLTKVVAGHKAQDLDLDRPVDVKKLRFFYMESAKDPRVSPICKELREAMNKVINKLTEEATSTEYVPKPYYHEGFNHMYSLWRYWMTKETDNFAKLLTNNKGEARFFEELPKKLIGKSNYTLAAIMKLADDQILPAVDAEWAEKLTAKLKQDLTDLLGTDGVLIFPSAPTPAPYHYSAVLKPYNFAYWGIFNVLKFPAAQIPLGVSAEGLPLGVQAAAGPHQDALCTATAAFLGPALGGAKPPCALP